MTSEDNIVGKIDRMSSNYSSYAWTINNVCACCPIKALISSPEFRTGLNNENIWVLGLQTISTYNLSKGTIEVISISLQLKDTAENSEVNAECTFSILDNKNSKFFVKTVTTTFTKEKWDSSLQVFQEDIRRSSCSIIPNKQLTILCEIKDSDGGKVIKYRDDKLLDVLKNLFEDPKHTDAKIVVGEKTFHVHKAILVSRSLWFKAAFEDGMKEQQKNEVTVSNYDDEVVREVLRFIYTGRVKGAENVVDRLLDAAVFYQLDELKIICSKILSDNLSVKNAFQTLYLADNHKVIDLKRKVFDFMALHTNDLVDVDITCSNECKNCGIDK